MFTQSQYWDGRLWQPIYSRQYLKTSQTYGVLANYGWWVDMLSQGMTVGNCGEQDFIV
jgi:hypothetical protein